ncbi:transposase [Marilutibacter spongiae]|uniref:Transposase n=1 Tax=Marilutibacter spongiae TaxID=2025720 RepID=A0A7W3TP62_9GAMM|nr:transposase [Lysobacter spongiae]MBB1061946.1 transposase [Lysobacter spongiae]
MPRRARLELLAIPMRITQRGVNRCAIFIDDEDRHHFRRLLRDAAQAHHVAVHAFVLMDNHVHLLLTGARAGDVSLVMRRVGQSYVQAFNARHGRSGTLWQGRFKSCLVDSDRYLLTVIRYIELNPVRAAMVESPDAYRWSSVHTHLGRARDPLITLPASYQALADTPEGRASAYRVWLQEGIDPDDLASIRQHLAQERALGYPRFQRMVAEALNRPVTCRPRGRPTTGREET